MEAPLNPVTLEKEMIDSINSISESIWPVSRAYDAWKTAELAYKREFALAFRRAEGSIKDREQAAVIEAADAAEAMKDAEIVYKRMLDFQRAARDKLSAVQTLSKGMNAAYGAAGAGER